jgi:hypothetical protein
VHFLVHVILPKDVGPAPHTRDVEEALERLLAPYGNMDGENDEGWWDWYEIGGRFTGTVAPAQPLGRPPRRRWLDLILPPRAPHHGPPPKDVLARWSDDKGPFVVVTPDGKAHGEDDWSKHDYAPWAAEFKELLARYSDHLVVGVDCHN